MLWLLPRAAPALLRHIAAYFELAAYDLEQSQRDLTVNLIASAVVGVGLFFAVLMGCVVIVALTWDTPHRVAAVAWTGAGFAAIAVIAIIYRARAIKAQAPFLACVRREWQEDLLLLEHILSDHQDRS
ncbi:MAG TPA: phage holin family protein [Steroidobacteraceae bacterium]|nr:phage holin family protein [Steroidobacteraceae bacterium]